jgi:MFS family permease
VIGRVYDNRGPQVLLAVPIAAAASAVAFTSYSALVWIGVAIWGIVNGIMDSTVKAVVTQLVPATSRAAAFGWLAFVRGVGLLVAGAALGLVYDRSVTAAIWLIIAVNGLGLATLWSVLRRIPRPEPVEVP